MPWTVDEATSGMVWVNPPPRVFDVMIDIESLGVKPGSVILSIGAIKFDPRTGEFGNDFYQKIAIADSQAYDLSISADTIEWWMKQTPEARESSFGGEGFLWNVLHTFGKFINAGEHVWSHGPVMDIVLLEWAFRRVGEKIPWEYGDVRCTRTIYDLAGVTPDRTKGTHHNALDDARAQALAVIAGYKTLGIAESMVPTPAAAKILMCG